MKILFLARTDNCTTQMAHGWLSLFDDTLTVCTAGVICAGRPDPHAIAVMKEANVDISRYTCDEVGKYVSQDWDYVVSVVGDALRGQVPFTGWIGQRLYFDLPDPSQQSGPAVQLHADYLLACNEIRDRIFDFYLRELLGKEILGADSCGIECDL
ncbi:MAG: arsenate reductase ArsC [Bacteroidales bacterium]